MSHCRLFDTSLVNPDMREFSFHLLNDKDYLPDVLLDTKKVMATAPVVFASSCQPFGIIGGNNKLCGVFYISDVVPGHDATFYIWVWDGKAVSHKTLPFIREYIEATADEYGLYRIVARTPCKKLCHLLEHLGFTLEGRFKSAWKSRGKLSVLFQLRRLFQR
jgi:RimJ/RimL family protein N-acetyltransferase